MRFYFSDGVFWVYIFEFLVSAKRKSAVELLQETKSLYVKSETVLDRKQELRRSLRSSGSSDKGSSSHDIASGCYNYKGTTLQRFPIIELYKNRSNLYFVKFQLPTSNK